LQQDIIQKAKNGDSLAVEEIVAQYKGLVRSLANRFYLVGGDKDDLLQEGMLGLIKAVNSYKEGESSFRTFATLCIKSSLYTAVKKYSANNALPLNNSEDYKILDKLDLFSENPEDEKIKQEGVSELIKNISDKLSKKENEILKLYLEGLSYDEISKKTNLNFKAIDNALQRARKKIKSIGD
jgi:RNA polymerase sporulation-specific sigma factor